MAPKMRRSPADPQCIWQHHHKPTLPASWHWRSMRASVWKTRGKPFERVFRQTAMRGNLSAENRKHGRLIFAKSRRVVAFMKASVLAYQRLRIGAAARTSLGVVKLRKQRRQGISTALRMGLFGAHRLQITHRSG